LSGHQILITDGGTGVTLNAPPPFFEWRGYKNKSVEYLTLVVSDTLGAVPLVVAQTGIVRAVDRDLQIVAAKSVAVGVRIREQATLEKMWKRCGITLVMIGNRTLYQFQPHNMPLFYYRIMRLTFGFKINKELS